MTVNTRKRLAQEMIERPDVASPAFIRLKGVVKEYRSEAGSFTALKGIDLEVGAGEFLGIIGRSGAGKSTLLNMISAVDHLTSGEVWVGDTQIHTLNQTQLSKWRGQTLGVIYQTFQLMPMLTLIDNVMLPIDFCGRYHPLKSVEKAAALLADLDIVEHAYKLPSQISGGQQQRVAIARALANDPALILADEPTGSLDSATATATMKILKRLAERGKTIIVATHDVSLMHYFTRMVMLFDGEIVNEVLARTFPMIEQQKLITAGRDFSRITYLPGQPIIKKDEAFSGLFIIIHGAAEVVVDGIVDVLSEGEFFGTRGLISGTPSPATITAAEPAGVEVGVLARTAFLELYREDKSFHEEMKQRF